MCSDDDDVTTHEMTISNAHERYPHTATALFPCFFSFLFDDGDVVFAGVRMFFGSVGVRD